MDTPPKVFLAPQKLVPDTTAGHKKPDVAVKSAESKILPKHLKRQIEISYGSAFKIVAPDNASAGILLAGHFQNGRKVISQEGSVTFSIQEGLYSQLKFSIDINKTETDGLGQKHRKLLNSYEIVFQAKYALDEGIAIIPGPHSAIADNGWLRSIVYDLIEKAKKERNIQEYEFLVKNWIEDGLRVFTVAFTPKTVSLGCSLNNDATVEEESDIQKYFNDVLGNPDYQNEVFRIFAVLQADSKVDKETKQKIYDTSFIQFFKELKEARLNEATTDPAMAYWNNPGEQRCLIRNGIKLPDQQPQLAWPSLSVYPFMRPFAHQMSVALANEFNLAKLLNNECRTMPCELRVVEFAKSMHGVFGGTLRVSPDFPTRIGERDILKLQFVPDIGRVWTAKPGVWTVSQELRFKDVQLKLSAPMDVYTAEDKSGNTYKHVSEARPPSIFSLTNQNGGKELTNYLDFGKPNSVIVTIERSDTLEEAFSHAWSILNKHHKSENDDKAIAKKFKNVLLGKDMTRQSIPMEFYGPNYDIQIETKGAQLAAFENAVSKTESIPEWHYSEEQLEVFRGVGTTGQITVLRGGAGTSKSETERGIVGHSVKAGKKVILVAPQNAIADKVIVDIQSLLDHLCPGSRAVRWLPFKGQKQYLEHIALGQPSTIDWDLPDGDDPGTSEEMRDILVSLRRIGERFNGVKDTRFRKVEHIPIGIFASETGLLGLKPVTLSKRPSPTSLSELKDHLKLEPRTTPDSIRDSAKLARLAELNARYAELTALGEGKRQDLKGSQDDTKNVTKDKDLLQGLSDVEKNKHLLHALCIHRRYTNFSTDQEAAFKLHTGEVLKDILASEEVKVVVATGFALSDPILRTFGASLIIFTEAQQFSIPYAMLGMAHFPDANYFFSGDSKQEGVFDVDLSANPAGEILQPSIIDWQVRAGKKCLQLSQGYRQEPEMLKLTSKLFYHSEMEVAPNMGPRPISNILRSWNYLYLKVGKKAPMAMINCADTEEETTDYTHSVCNPREADYAVFLALKLVADTPIQPNQITLLTGYRAQASLLQNAVDRQPRLEGIIVSTVRGYLSSENEVVIHSAVRTESHGFTSTSRHQASVVTRAKSGYYLICNATKLEMIRRKNMFWEKIKKELVDLRAYCSWPLPSPPQYSKVFDAKVYV